MNRPTIRLQQAKGNPCLAYLAGQAAKQAAAVNQIMGQRAHMALLTSLPRLCRDGRVTGDTMANDQHDRADGLLACCCSHNDGAALLPPRSLIISCDSN